MTNTPNPRSDDQTPADLPYESTADAAGQRGQDDRKSEVNPAENPAPTSPAHDEEAVSNGEDSLNSVSPH